MDVWVRIPPWSPRVPFDKEMEPWYIVSMPYKDAEKAKAAKAEWYQKNKTLQRERNKHSNRTMETFVREAKSKPCTDCGNQYPYYVMDFDHIGTDKILGVAQLRRCASLERVKAEI